MTQNTSWKRKMLQKIDKEKTTWPVNLQKKIKKKKVQRVTRKTALKIILLL
jgi:hypothetical protein